MGHNFKPVLTNPGIAPQASSSDVARMAVRAARLIEAAMLTCTESDIHALDCLLQARRALSPVVDQRKASK